jgi:SulP family sulfate permease
MSEGLANVGGAFFQCYPGSGSLTRSALNVEAGAASQWSGVISAGAVATIMLLFAPYAAFIPRAALAGVLIVTAVRMIDAESLRWHVRATRADALIVATTALAAVAISIEFCILVGVLISFVLYVPKAARITMIELVVTRERLIRQRVDGDPKCPKFRVWSLEGELFFGAAPELEACFEQIRGQIGPEMKVVVLRCRELRNADAVCIHVFGEFLRELQQRDLQVIVCGVRPEVREVFENTGLDAIIGADRLLFERPVVWTGTLEAVRLAYQLLGEDLCEACPRRLEPLDDRASQAGWHYQI